MEKCRYFARYYSIYAALLSIAFSKIFSSRVRKVISAPTCNAPAG